jgi:hypothetical protein
MVVVLPLKPNAPLVLLRKNILNIICKKILICLKWLDVSQTET